MQTARDLVRMFWSLGSRAGGSSLVRRLTLVGLASGLLGACTPDSQVEGSVSGAAFGSVLSAFYMIEDAGPHELLLVLTSYGDGCGTYASYFESGGEPAGSGPHNALFFRQFLLEPVAPGTYEVQALNGVDDDGISFSHAWFRTFESAIWTAPEDAAATGGTLTLTTLDAGVLTGSFDLSLSTGDALSGYFDADLCDVADF